MHSNLIDEDRSVKSPGDHSECVSALFMSHKNSQKISRQASKMEYNLCYTECRYRLIVRICIVAHGVYFSTCLCSPFWKLKVIRDLNRKNC